MPTIFSNFRFVGEAEETLLTVMDQGEQFTWEFTWTDENDDAIDLTGWVITAVAEHKIGQPTGSGHTTSIDRATIVDPDPPIANRALAVTIMDQSKVENVGRFSVLIPEDLWQLPINPAGELRPVISVFIKSADNGAPPNIDYQPLLITIRHTAKV